jgi:hypothetical protein
MIGLYTTYRPAIYLLYLTSYLTVESLFASRNVENSIDSCILFRSASYWIESLPVFSRNRIVALMIAGSGVHFSFRLPSSSPVLTSFLVPHAPRR